MPGGIVGREAEFAAVAGLMDDLAAGPAVLALWGEAGIGKTTVWTAGVERARDSGFVTLVCRPAAAEVRLSHAGLADLLADLGPDELGNLPQPQRRALDAALLRGVEDDRAPDPRAVATGLVSVLDHLAQTAPVLVAIDDIQWLDDPTRRVVEFAVRRCSGPVGVLTTRRVDPEESPADELTPRDPARRQVVRVGPLSLGALHHVLKQRTGRAVPRQALVRIVELSAGNPFFALELARDIDAPTARMTVPPRSLQSLVADRLAALPPPVREALLVASSLAEPRVDVVEGALAGSGAVALLEVAEDAGVVELSRGVVRFVHPLLASVVSSEAPAPARRAVHRRLSGLVEDVEERARHLALATVGPDADAVMALDAAAARARARGAPSAAAELLGLAMDLGANDPGRRVQAAHDHFNADDPARARQLVESAIAQLGPGSTRADALVLLGTIRYQAEDYAAAIEILQRAVDEAGSDAALRVVATMELCFALINSGHLDDALSLLVAGVEQAEQVGDRGLLAEALGGLVIVRFLAGQDADSAMLGRALALEDRERPSHATLWPQLNATMVALWSHRVDEAQAQLAALRERCLERGLESDLWFVSYHQADVALCRGQVETAEQVVADMEERAALAGGDTVGAMAQVARAHLQAWVGRIDDARRNAEEALARLTSAGMTSGQIFTLRDLGMVELSVGNHDGAAGWLRPAAEAMRSMGLREPAVAPLLPDAVEALVALGRLDEAGPLVDLLEASGRRPGRHWARAVGARARALLLGAQGRSDDTVEAFRVALDAHDELPQLRYDRARTLLALGQLQRRRNQRRDAQGSLTEAAELFDRVGTAQWARNARDELGRLGLRPGPTDELTPTELHVAERAASGLTNREVAAALFVSPKTVEAHLRRVYRKLGIHSRAELGRHMAQRK